MKMLFILLLVISGGIFYFYFYTLSDARLASTIVDLSCRTNVLEQIDNFNRQAYLLKKGNSASQTGYYAEQTTTAMRKQADYITRTVSLQLGKQWIGLKQMRRALQERKGDLSAEYYVQAVEINCPQVVTDEKKTQSALASLLALLMNMDDATISSLR